MTTIFEAYHRELRPVAYGLAPNSWEDVLQDAYIRAFEGFPKFRGEPQAVLGWLMIIVRRLAYDTHRRTSREDLGPVVDEPRAGGQRELGLDLGIALRRLSGPLCEAILLVDYLGLSYDEAAMAANTKPGTVASRLNTARRQLREALSESRPSNRG